MAPGTLGRPLADPEPVKATRGSAGTRGPHPRPRTHSPRPPSAPRGALSSQQLPSRRGLCSPGTSPCTRPTTRGLGRQTVRVCDSCKDRRFAVSGPQGTALPAAGAPRWPPGPRVREAASCLQHPRGPSQLPPARSDGRSDGRGQGRGPHRRRRGPRHGSAPCSPARPPGSAQPSSP